MWTDARKIFVNPKKRIVKFEFVTFGPMRGSGREVVQGESGREGAEAQERREGGGWDWISNWLCFALGETQN